MARQEKNDVGYFPHDVTHGRKMSFIENKYKNDGYAVWFKLLERLGAASFHYLDISDPVTLMYLASGCNVTETLLKSIITDLVTMGEFDKEFYEGGILFNQKFVDSIEDAYVKRKNAVVKRNELINILHSKGLLLSVKLPPLPDNFHHSTPENTQRKGKETKEDKIKVKEIKIADYVAPAFSEIFKLWLSYKKERGQVYKSEKSIQACYNKLINLSKNDAAAAAKMIDNAIAGNWAGFFELKPETNTNYGNNKQSTTNFGSKQTADTSGF